MFPNTYTRENLIALLSKEDFGELNPEQDKAETKRKETKFNKNGYTSLFEYDLTEEYDNESKSIDKEIMQYENDSKITPDEDPLL